MMISTEKALQELIGRAMQAPAVALDTEFVWERTFYPNLGLVQLALGRDCYFIDPVAIGDLAALGQLLANPNVIKVLHDAPQDLTILKNATGALPVNIFDTRLAYGFCSDSSILSLVALLEKTLKITLAKTETRTNWLKRPLSDKQLEYAGDDVKYLIEVMELIMDEAKRQQTQEWLQNEMKRYDNPELYAEIAPHKYFRKIRGNDRLNSRQLAIMRELSTWREKMARRANRPRGHIIHNNSLLDLVYRAPQRVEDLSKIKQLHQRTIDKYGTALINCIATATALPPQHQPTVAPKLTKRAEVKLILAAINAKAEKINIDPTLLCSNKELNNILTVAKTNQQPLFQGWRAEFMQELYQNPEISSLGICQ